MVDGFRILGKEASGIPAHQLEPPDNEDDPSEETIFVGSTHRVNEDGEHISVGSIWYTPDDERNTRIPVDKDLCSKDAGVAAAILFTIQNTPWETTLHFVIESKQVVRNLTTDLGACEDQGWVGVPDSTILRSIVATLRGQGKKCSFQKAGRNHSIGMKNANALAMRTVNDDEPLEIRIDVPDTYDLNGLRLSRGTQKSFYRALKSQRKKPERVKTLVMLDMTRHAARHLSGKTPTDEEIWKSIRHPDITRTTREFMWKSMHQAYKIGERWRSIPTFEHWATCQHCQVDETMEHILTECEAPGRRKLWDMAQTLWEMRGYQWPEVTIGGILACGFAEVEDARGKKDSGANRLYRILISETAHLIWKFRCTRVIENGSDPAKHPTEYELHNKWLGCINSRLKMDFLLTDQKKFGTRALKLKAVVNTWKAVLKDVENLTDIQIRQSRVLVGMTPLRPPGRNQ
ncbi:hypothetical protein B0H12DRAFT_1025321 [Mycena haematopus]|nr:hypothetical protein B0H12DRAFT_1025321 [Mycena haematopus]